MDASFAQIQGYDTYPLKSPRRLEVFNGLETSASKITYIAVALMIVGDHHEPRALFFLTQLSENPIVLGLPWLAKHEVTIKAAILALIFESDHC